MRKRLQLALMLTATTAIATSFLHPLQRPGRGPPRAISSSETITATQEHGRKIYVNEDGAGSESSTPAAPAKRSSLVYWSSKESRWKPVPSAGTASMRAARSAAAEVSQYYGHESVQSANAKIVAANSRGHQASPEEIDSRS